MTASPRIVGFRLGIYVFKDAEIVDFAAPHGVFSVARRLDPELDAFMIADASRPVQCQAGFTVLPNYSFTDAPAMDAFLIPGGFGTRQEMHNRRLQDFVRSLPEACCSRASAPAPGSMGGWVCARDSPPPPARSRTGSSPRASAWCRSTGSPRSPPGRASAARGSWTRGA